MACTYFFSYICSLFCKNEYDPFDDLSIDDLSIDDSSFKKMTIDLSLIYDQYVDEENNVADILDIQRFYNDESQIGDTTPKEYLSQ